MTPSFSFDNLSNGGLTDAVSTAKRGIAVSRTAPNIGGADNHHIFLRQLGTPVLASEQVGWDETTVVNRGPCIGAGSHYLKVAQLIVGFVAILVMDPAAFWYWAKKGCRDKPVEHTRRPVAPTIAQDDRWITSTTGRWTENPWPIDGIVVPPLPDYCEAPNPAQIRDLIATFESGNVLPFFFHRIPSDRKTPG